MAVETDRLTALPSSICCYLTNRITVILCIACVFISACGGSSGGDDGVGDGGGEDEIINASDFSLRSLPTNMQLIEGDSQGLDIPLDLTRSDGHTADISLSIEGITEQDSAFVSTAFSNDSLSSANNQTSVNLRLEIGVLPILPQQRNFRIIATDGTQSDTHTITVNVEPTESDDVYLLIGQSNMVGFGGDGQKDASAGGADEANERILQFNVSPNGEFDVFLTPDDYTSVDQNFRAPRMTKAIDPLHVPVDEFTLDKAEDYIGLGLSFAKQALPSTSRNIILVPAAWSGTSFCDTSIAPAHWNALPTDAANHGNTLMFDRALTRVNHALEFSGGVLRGILWHQGESDANIECAGRYGVNLQILAEQLRSQIIPDQRGTVARKPYSNLPFVVGTMSRGVDDRGDFSEYSDEKNIVDQVHRTISSRVLHSAVSIHDDLIPENGYPCGNTSCIHFGTLALREAGRRYYQALVEAASN